MTTTTTTTTTTTSSTTAPPHPPPLPHEPHGSTGASVATDAAATVACNGATTHHNDTNSSTTNTNPSTLPKNTKHVGILALETYFPSTYVQQSELETHLGVSSGKFTIGLGQCGIAVTGDVEDVNSLCLTVLQNLLEKHSIDPRSIGRLEVGTETLVDKSKSTKTVLMELFPQNHTNVEGATIVNACYGGTAALLNAMLWCESDGWDGKYAIVIAADVATYARGPARPTGGAGAVAILIGRDAPLSFDPTERTTHATHVWDFFKPDPSVEHPVVDGALSQSCYYNALEDVYLRLVDKLERTAGKGQENQLPLVNAETLGDYYCFHAPYNKLVQKSFARLTLLDARRKHQRQEQERKLEQQPDPVEHEPVAEEKKADVVAPSFSANGDSTAADHPLQPWLTVPLEDTYGDKQLEKVLQGLSRESFATKCGDANHASQWIGNTYTASVFFGLASLVDRSKTLCPGQTIVVFSYGSGALATMYRLHV